MGDDGVEPRAPVNEGNQTLTTIVGVLHFSIDIHYQQTKFSGLNLIGGLAKDTTLDQFTKYFGKYGEITDSVIMNDRHTGRPRGFGFITYADPSIVDTVIAETHVINDKQVEIKRTIPKGSAKSKDFKTKKIFVGGIPTSVTEDEFKNFFSKYGKVVEHEIIRDHVTKRSRGFGFVVFDNEQVVDTILANGNKIDMEGSQTREQKRAALLKEKRASSGLTSPPRVIVLVACHLQGHSWEARGGHVLSFYF
ncbi:hypothetical protein CsSME_00029004 [Camellia sinensis var. sinensis]